MCSKWPCCTACAYAVCCCNVWKIWGCQCFLRADCHWLPRIAQQSGGGWHPHDFTRHMPTKPEKDGKERSAHNQDVWYRCDYSLCALVSPNEKYDRNLLPDCMIKRKTLKRLIMTWANCVWTLLQVEMQVWSDYPLWSRTYTVDHPFSPTR